MDSNALMTMDEAKMLQRVEMARFPQDLSLADKKLLAEVAITYGFDPLMGEITIYEGRPYVSIDGRYRKAQETGQLDGVQSRPANKKEREEWEIADGDYFFKAEVFVKNASHPFIGWGRVRASETKPGSRRQGDTTSTYKPIQNNPQRMAEKRAEAQALRKAFHIPLPSIEDIGSADAEVSEVRVIDITTGEINKKAITKPTQAPTSTPDDRGREGIESASSGNPPEDQERQPETDTGLTDLLLQVEEGMEQSHFKLPTLKSWIKSRALYTGLDTSGELEDIIGRMNQEQRQFLLKELQDRLAMR